MDKRIIHVSNFHVSPGFHSLGGVKLPHQNIQLPPKRKEKEKEKEKKKRKKGERRERRGERVFFAATINARPLRLAKYH